MALPKPILSIVQKRIPRKPRCNKVLGCYYSASRLIEIDPRQGRQSYLTTAVHELLHHVNPSFSEYQIQRRGVIIGTALWAMGYRKQGETMAIRLERKKNPCSTGSND